MNILKELKDFYNFLKEDSWQSWIVGISLVVVFVKAIFFPLLSLITGTALPLVVIESCSMYHDSSFENWWSENYAWYESHGINKEVFENFSFKNGLNKGDIILVWGKDKLSLGDIIIFKSQTNYPIIHRIVNTSPLDTKGDNNSGQLSLEKNIKNENIMGKAIFRIPYLGWVKLIFFDITKPQSERGPCK